MAEKLLMLALSPTMEKGTIVKWRKKEGDQIAIGDIICEVETDKATMEYESVNEGTLLKLLLPEGLDTRVGEPIAIVGRQGEDISQILEELKAEMVKRESAGEGALQREAPVTEVPVIAPAGRPFETRGEAQGVISPGVPGAPGEHLPGGVMASPLAREIAERHGIDIRTIRGSGPEGRIVKRDVDAAVKGMAAGVVSGIAGTVRAAATGAPGPAGTRVPPGVQIPGTQIPAGIKIPAEAPVVLVPVSGKRRVIAKRLSESKFSAPHYYLKTVVSVDNLLNARKKLNEGREDKVSLNAFLMRLAAEALKMHPAVNSSWRGESIARFQRADIGLAVAQPDGLITPIVRDCWNKGIVAIDQELRVLIDRALKSSLKPEEYTGATFTISNLGSYDILEFTAIINPPGSAILAVGKGEKSPVVGEDGLMKIETRMTLTLSCDHRVIDGVEGALYMKDLKGMIEYPINILY